MKTNLETREKTKENQIDNQLWECIPAELLKEVLTTFNQKNLLKSGKLVINGFRSGKIPKGILLPKVYGEYQRSSEFKLNLRKSILRYLAEISERVKKIPLRSLEAQMPELIAEFSESMAFMAIFLDERTGIRKLAPTLWGKKADIQNKYQVQKRDENVKPLEKYKENEPVETKKLHKKLEKVNKKIKLLEQEHVGAIAEKNRRISSQDNQMKALHKLLAEKDAKLKTQNEILLENKKRIAKFEDTVASKTGMLRSAATKLAEMHEQISRLEHAVKQMQPGADESKIPVEKLDPEANIGAQEMKDNVDSQYEEIFGYVLYKAGDYWAVCSDRTIYLGINAVLWAGATEGDPVAVRVKPVGGNKGYIKKVYSNLDQVQGANFRKKSIRNAVTSEIKQYDNLLQGKKILIVGGDPIKNRFIQEVQRTGADVTWHTGHGELNTLSAKVSSVDIVLTITSSMSHKVFYIVRDAAKHSGRKLVMYNGIGIREAIEVLLESTQCDKSGVEMIS